MLGRKQSEPPQGLIDAINFWQKQPRFVNDGVNDGDALTRETQIKPRTAMFTDGARILFYAYMKQARINMRDSKRSTKGPSGTEPLSCWQAVFTMCGYKHIYYR